MNPPKNNSRPIGMFDSGVGGLTVMQEVMRKLPCASIIYFADTARIPYGEKSKESIIRFSIENTTFLMQYHIKLLVVACNTASAYALDDLKQKFDIPIIGVIESGAEKAVKVTKNKRLAVVGTRGTINSGVYQKVIQKQLPGAEIFSLSCPLLVPLIEEKLIDHPATRLILEEYLSPLRSKDVDTLLLGCTHYPLLHRLFQEYMGDEVIVVDSATTCAEAVASVISNEQGLHHLPQYSYFVSDDPQKFQTMGKEFLGMPVENVLPTQFLS